MSKLEVGDNVTVYDIGDGQIGLCDGYGVIHWFNFQGGDEYDDDGEETEEDGDDGHPAPPGWSWVT